MRLVNAANTYKFVISALVPFFALHVSNSLASETPRISCLKVAQGFSNWFERLTELRGKPLSITDVGSKKIDGDTQYIAHGVPSRAQFREVRPGEVFRHYSTAIGVDKIVSSTELISGNLPYITTGGGVRTSYVDLTGIFLTRAEFKPESVGVEASIAHTYVDLQLPVGTKIIELEPGIILIPGPARLPDWVVKFYVQWRTTPEAVPPYARRSMEEIDAKGGVQTPLHQPIVIIRSSK